MAHEITPWQQADCVLTLAVDDLSKREPHSSEINKMYGEGGALNANYRTVEAVAVAVSTFATNGMFYGMHFVFKTGGNGEISFDFRNQQDGERGRSILRDWVTHKFGSASGS